MRLAEHYLFSVRELLCVFLLDSRRTRLALVVLGILLCCLPFIFAGGTLAACSEPPSVFDYRISEIQFPTLEMFWYDGCNGRNSSAFPIVVGVGLILTTLVNVVRASRGDS